MRIILTAIDDALERAWKKHCGNLLGVEVFRGDIFQTWANAIVSPANSFGFMDGGIDLHYVRHFGPEIEADVKATIKNKFLGELPVGRAFCVITGRIPAYLIVSPTMRVPMILPKGTINPYLAMSAILRLTIADRFDAIAVPGLGTGVGGIDPMMCAWQVRQAIVDWSCGWPMPETWQESQQRHNEIAGV